MNASTRMEARLAQDGVRLESCALFFDQHKRYGVFSNFSAHAIVLPSPWTRKLVTYQTSEHRFQAMKPDNQRQHDDIVAANGPGGAKALGGICSLREGWTDPHVGSLAWYVMLEALVAKAIQHEVMYLTLEQTKWLWIYEDSPVDDIWGWRYHTDYRGKNLLGLGLMHTRHLVGITKGAV